MRKISIVSAAGLVVIAAGVAMAASPAPSPTAAPSPAPTTRPQATPSPTTPATPAAGAAASTWSAAIKPLTVTTGQATVVEGKNGGGTITIKLVGLLADVRWTVDVDGGTVAKPLEAARHEIAFRAGLGVEKISSDTIRIHLTKAEMKAFLADRSSMGVVVLVSDGTNRSAATFTNS